MFKDISLACVYKIITADNYLKFAEISDLETETLSIHFARPYFAWEHGPNGSHKSLLRKFILKEMPI